MLVYKRYFRRNELTIEFTDTRQKLQDTVDKLHTESERYGMHINVVEAKAMVFGKKARRERCFIVVVWNGRG